jgi:hypothetical protein
MIVEPKHEFVFVCWMLNQIVPMRVLDVWRCMLRYANLFDLVDFVNKNDTQWDNSLTKY